MKRPFPKVMLMVALLGIAVLAAWPAWSDIWTLAARDEEQSHIWLAVPVAAWLGWMRRKRLRRAEPDLCWLGPVAAVACIVGQTRNQARDGCRNYQGGDEALGGACLDAAADVPCRAIAKSCKTSLDECRGLLSGMNAAGRAKMSACAAQGCSYGLWSCVESL